MKAAIGGRTVYGLALGVVILDTAFPRLVGDIGHAATWPFPVTYRIVRGALPERMAQPDPDPTLLAPFVEAVHELADEGVRGIVTSCGFLASYQAELAAASPVPVFASPLLQVPMAARVIRPNQRVAIFTAREVLTDRHFRGTGWSAHDLPVVQLAPPPESHFVETFVGNAPKADVDLLERDVAELTERALRDHPDIGAIVLECANFSPFAQAVRDIAQRPVFDLYTLVMHAYLTTAGTTFPR